MLESPPSADISIHEDRFRSYAESKLAEASQDPSPLHLKMRHTFEVLANARAIAKEEKLEKNLARACALAALYHDIARFDQYLRFGTFKDANSRNHGLWSVEIVRKHGFLDDEPAPIRKFVLTAIAVHNKIAIPEVIQEPARAICHVLRDADKLDILRVMDQHLSAPGPYNPTVVLSLPDNPSLASSKVIQCALRHMAPSYGDLQSVNDFRLLLCTWFFTMNFPSSKQMFLASGHAARIVRDLPENGPYARARAEILRCLEIPAA